MSIALDGVVRLAAGLLSDPGTSSKNLDAIASKAVELYKVLDSKVQAENARLSKPAPKAPAVTSKE